MTAPGWHGTESGYTNHRCRCTECKAVHARNQRARRAERKRRGVPEHVHGKESGYTNYGCRCDACRGARRDAVRGLLNLRQDAVKALEDLRAENARLRCRLEELGVEA